MAMTDPNLPDTADATARDRGDEHDRPRDPSLAESTHAQSADGDSGSATDSEGTPSSPGHDGIDVEEARAQVIAALKRIFDPEIPIDIYELGLIYRVDIQPNGFVEIDMTLTSPACPVAGSLPPEVEFRVGQCPLVDAVLVNVVWDPPWSPDKMSEAARLELNMW